MYQDRVVPLGRFLAVHDGYDRIAEAWRGVRENASDPSDAARQVEAALGGVDQQWSAYLATCLIAEETALAADLLAQIDRNAATIAGILEGLREADVAERLRSDAGTAWPFTPPRRSCVPAGQSAAWPARSA